MKPFQQFFENYTRRELLTDPSIKEAMIELYNKAYRRFGFNSFTPRQFNVVLLDFYSWTNDNFITINKLGHSSHGGIQPDVILGLLTTFRWAKKIQEHQYIRTKTQQSNIFMPSRYKLLPREYNKVEYNTSAF